MLFAPEILEDTVGCLQEMIFEHHSQFVKLYPEFGVIPKMHYMVHMPRLIVRFVSHICPLPLVDNYTVRDLIIICV